jgi:hypothetical protein
VNTLIKIVSSIALLSSLLDEHALADQLPPDQVAAPSISSTKPGIHLVLNVGATFGGDTIYSASANTHGATGEIEGGGGYQLGVGELWQLEDRPVALMMSANYHFEHANSSHEFVTVGNNFDAEFKRYPLEMLAYYTGKERFRIGGGIRLVISPKATVTENGITNEISFNNTIGLVAEIGYQVIPHLWTNFRAVTEKYHTSGGVKTPWTGNTAISGNHFGINVGIEF